jgi:hypothetical protein
MTGKTAICFVVHKGYLEIQGILLAASIRFHNGSDYDLFVATPSFLGGVENGLNKDTYEFLSRLGVKFIETENLFEQNYLIGNKFGCLNQLEGYKKKLFLDTDIICMGKLDLPQIKHNQIAIKPADRKTYTWSDEDWKSAYREFSQTTAPVEMVKSSCFHEQMYPYFNAGVIYLNSERDFGNEWQQLSLKLDKNNNYQNKRPWLDQLALPLIIKKLDLNVVLLSEQLNFPANIKHQISSKVQLVHYHHPKNIARNQYILKNINRLISAFPELSALLSSHAEWDNITDVLKSYKRNKKQLLTKMNDVLITGIPRSGTSLLSSLLSRNKNNVVINEPQGFPKPLKRRSLPWGIHGLYLDLRKDIIIQTPIMNKHKNGELIDDTVVDNKRRKQTFPDIPPDFNLFIKNTLAGLVGIERIIKTFPSLKVLICVRDPIDTLASWKTSFEHLVVAKPLEIGVISAQLKWLNVAEQNCLLEIENVSEANVRRALLWRFLAKKIIGLSMNAKLINYTSLTNDTQLQINSIQKYLGLPEFEIDSKLESRSKKHLFNQSEIDQIVDICGATYSKLCELNTV